MSISVKEGKLSSDCLIVWLRFIDDPGISVIVRSWPSARRHPNVTFQVRMERPMASSHKKDEYEQHTISKRYAHS
jgi:hypothetical protein